MIRSHYLSQVFLRTSTSPHWHWYNLNLPNDSEFGSSNLKNSWVITATFGDEVDTGCLDLQAHKRCISRTQSCSVTPKASIVKLGWFAEKCTFQNIFFDAPMQFAKINKSKLAKLHTWDQETIANNRISNHLYWITRRI